MQYINHINYIIV